MHPVPHRIDSFNHHSFSFPFEPSVVLLGTFSRIRNKQFRRHLTRLLRSFRPPLRQHSIFLTDRRRNSVRLSEFIVQGGSSQVLGGAEV